MTPRGVLGLTDTPRAPLIAKAKIGERVGDAPEPGKPDRRPPRRLDYIKFCEPYSGKHLPEVQALMGEKPTSFVGVLPSNVQEEVWDVAWKRYGKAGLKCRGDGETAIDQETGEELPCAGHWSTAEGCYTCSHANPTTKNGKEVPPDCKPILTLRVIAPNLPGLGVIQIDTGGVASSIPTLSWQLQRIYEWSGGQMQGIAVRIAIKPFKDRFGNIAYSWHLEPLSQEETQTLSFAAPARIMKAVPQGTSLPEIAPPDADLYGFGEEPEDDPKVLPAPNPPITFDPEGDAAFPEAEEVEAIHEAITQVEQDREATPHEEERQQQVNQAAQAFDAFSEWVHQHFPKGKADRLTKVAQDNLEICDRDGTFSEFIQWCANARDRLERELQKEQQS